MSRTVQPSFIILIACLALAVSPLSAQPAGDDNGALPEKAMKAAMQRVAPSIVQIQTSGGLDIIGGGEQGNFRKGIGPTTGLVVAPDGYIISSAFNFANKPTEIFVSVPGKKDRYVAKVVANDLTRMVTLLKIEANQLPVPEASPKKEFRVGQWALALGRTWGNADSSPSMSVGILSALDRIWGKAVQTDAKVSPVNYGGPLVDIRGRVQGVLVPASPRGQDETAGHEWYDSGIGFAIPLEDIMAALPQLKQGKDLKRGYLGITARSGDIYEPPVIGTVTPGSVAAQAGLKPGDVVTEIDGVPVASQAQMLHQLGKKYEGDAASVKVKRGAEELSFAGLRLAGLQAAVLHAFLGILPMRDDPEPGVEIRYVFPKSPAEAAGLKAGDRIMAVGRDKEAKKFSGGEELAALLNALAPGAEVKLEVRRKGGDKSESLSAKLAALPDTVPEKLPEEASRKKALAPRKTEGEPQPPKEGDKPPPKKKIETGMLKRTNAARDHEYWIFVPDNYDPNVSHALVLWLHAAGKGKDKDAEALVAAWRNFCEDQHVILAGPKAVNESGWLVSEADFAREAIREVAGQFTIDRQRIVAHGMGAGGQLALYLGLNTRDLVRGVASTGAALANPPKENSSPQRLSFFIIAGEKDPRAKAILDTKNKLLEQKFPVVYREIAEMGHQYLDLRTLMELVRWIDSLDRV